MIFELFEDIRFLKKFWPTTQIFKNTPRPVEISADPKISGVVTLGPKKSSETRGRIFWPILASKQSQMQNFTRFFTLKIFLRDRNFWP